MAHALIALAPVNLKLTIVEIGNLPLYNQDLDGSPPGPWVAFRERIQASNAVIFVTPEYNRSVPGVLKNAIDVGSRPYGHSVWNRKPGAIVSCSPGAIGGFGSNHHLRQSLVFLNMPAMQQPEAYIGGADKLFGPDGKLVNEGTGKFLQSFMNAFVGWVEANAPK
jgi:chromate reductase